MFVNIAIVALAVIHLLLSWGITEVTRERRNNGNR